jgi:hypothetical protein
MVKPITRSDTLCFLAREVEPLISHPAPLIKRINPRTIRITEIAIFESIK